MKDAVKAYNKEVKTSTFPETEHTFKISDDVLEKLY